MVFVIPAKVEVASTTAIAGEEGAETVKSVELLSLRLGAQHLNAEPQA